MGKKLDDSKLYFLAYKGFQDGYDKDKAPKQVVFVVNNEKIVVPYGKCSERPFPRRMATFLAGKQKMWGMGKGNGAVITLEAARGSEMPKEAPAGSTKA